MIKMLIADDEPIEREGFRTIIKKNFTQIEIVAEAKNGREAIEYAEVYRPDIIFLDIKMPGIDGIQAAREIRNKRKDVKLVILSAYDHFSYAKESLSLDVYDYLLKPVRRKKLIELLTNLEKNIEKERTERSEKLRLKENLLGIKSVMKERFISLILEEDAKKLKEIIATTNILDFNFEDYFLIGIDIKNLIEESDFKKLYDLCYKSFKKRNECILSTYNNILYILIENIDFKKLDIEENLQEISLLFKNKNVILNYSFENSEKLENLKSTILKIREKLSIKFHTAIAYNLEERLKICNELTNSNKEYLLTFKKMIASISKKEFENKKDFYFEILQILSYLQYGAYKEREKIYFKDTINLIKAEKNVSHIKNSLFLEVDNYLEDHKSKNYETIDCIKQYIIKNYHLDLKLEDLAYKFSISSYYLSKLFKQETGYNFVEFLTQIRIEKAKKMLLEGIPIKKIYKKVGYSDPNYFSRVFKKITGVSPRNYKE